MFTAVVIIPVDDNDRPFFGCTGLPISNVLPTVVLALFTVARWSQLANSQAYEGYISQMLPLTQDITCMYSFHICLQSLYFSFIIQCYQNKLRIPMKMTHRGGAWGEAGPFLPLCPVHCTTKFLPHAACQMSDKAARPYQMHLQKSGICSKKYVQCKWWLLARIRKCVVSYKQSKAEMYMLTGKHIWICMWCILLVTQHTVADSKEDFCLLTLKCFSIEVAAAAQFLYEDKIFNAM